MMFAASETDSVDPFATESGSETFHADIRHAVTNRTAKSSGSG
jgi:hypothetical protein